MENWEDSTQIPYKPHTQIPLVSTSYISVIRLLWWMDQYWYSNIKQSP